MSNQRKKGLPRWLEAVLKGLFGSDAFQVSLKRLANNKIESLPEYTRDERIKKGVWRIFSRFGFASVDILSNDNPDNKSEFGELLENNIDILLYVGFDAFKKRIIAVAKEKENRKLTQTEFSLLLEAIDKIGEFIQKVDVLELMERNESKA